MRQAESATRNAVPGRIEVFEYPGSASAPHFPAWEGWQDAADSASSAPGPSPDVANSAAVAGLQAEFDRRLAEEKLCAFEEGRERGRQEGRLAEREAQGGALAAAAQLRTQQIAETLENFARERDKFLQAIEHEVVELALAIAARILRREAQMDPLLLTGAVRVALGQLSETTQVRLLVPAEELEMWIEAMALLPNLALRPTVVAGEGMRLGDCAIETELGTVDLGIRAQLSEIERGFFDRAGARSIPVAEAGQERSR